MLPSFSVGGLAVAERVPTSALALRDVIVFAAPGRAGREVARRVVSLRRTSTGLLVRTEGDARARPDRWTLHLAGGHVDVVRLTLPLLGYLVSWDTSGNGATATLLVAGAVVVLLAGGVLAVEWDGPGNPPGPVRPQPDNGEPDRTEQDSPQADNGEPDRTEQDSPQPDNGEPDRTEQDSPQPDNGEPDRTEQDSPQADNGEPDRTEQDSPQPDNGEPDRPEPDSPQADRSQPDRSETDRPEPGRGEAPD